MARKKPNQTLLLSSNDIQILIQKIGVNEIMDHLIAELEKEIYKFDPKDINTPARSGFNYSNPNIGLIEWMPLYESGSKVTNKIVGYHPNNPSKYQLPTILSTISQYDTHTGHLIGIADGVLLTALRTGAASALATNYLSSETSEILGLIGCGAQSITQLHAISRIRSIKEVYYYDIDADTLLSFQSRASSIDIDLTYKSASIEEIVQKSDILCTATSVEVNQGPLFDALEAKKHLHINAVGSDFPGKIELPVDMINNSFLCPDFVEQALKEGECQRVTRDRIDADLREVIINRSKYESNKRKLSVFDSTGWALEDHVVMNVFMQYAKQYNIGKEIDLEFIPEDSKSPYEFLERSVQTDQQEKHIFGINN